MQHQLPNPWFYFGSLAMDVLICLLMLVTTAFRYLNGDITGAQSIFRLVLIGMALVGVGVVGFFYKHRLASQMLTTLNIFTTLVLFTLFLFR